MSLGFGRGVKLYIYNIIMIVNWKSAIFLTGRQERLHLNWLATMGLYIFNLFLLKS